MFENNNRVVKLIWESKESSCGYFCVFYQAERINNFLQSTYFVSICLLQVREFDIIFDYFMFAPNIPKLP